AAEDAPLRVFDLHQGRPVRAFARTGGSPLCVAIAPDGRQAVVGSSDRTVRVFDLAGGQCARTLEGHEDAVLAVAVGPTRIVSGGRDGTVRVWDAGTGRAVAVHRGHTSRVNAVALDEERQRLASGSEDRSVRLWPWDAEGPPTVWLGPTQAVTCLAFETRGRFLVAGSQDRGLRFYDLSAGSLHAVVRLDAAVTAVAPSGLELVLGHGSTVSRLAVPEQARLPAPALSRPTSSIEAQQRQGEFETRLAEARAHLEAADLDRALDAARAARAIPGFGRAPAALAVWASLADRLPRGALAGAWEDRVLARHDDQVLALVASRELVASGGTDRTLRLVPPDGGEPRVLLGHEGPVSALAAFPVGHRLVSGSWDGTLRLWNAVEGKAHGECRGHGGYVVALAVAPDGRRVASGSLDQTLRLWRADGSPEKTLQGHRGPVSAVAFSPDGRVVVSGSWDGTLRLWDAESGAPIAALGGHRGNVTAVAVAPTGLLFASGGADATLRLWDASARRETAVLEGHAAEVTTVAFTGDGRFLVSASRDGTARLWAVSRREVVRALSHPAPLLAAALVPGDHRLVTGGTERAVRSWHLDWEPERPEPRLRLKPQTIRAQAPQPATATPTLRTARAPGSAPVEPDWNDIARGASRTLLRPPASVREPLPWKRIAQGVAALAVVAASVLAWRGTRPSLHVVEPVAESLRAEPDLIRIDAFRGQCGGGAVADLLERVRAPEVSAPDIACLAATQDPGVVSAYFQTMSLEDADALRVKRLHRNAVSLMAGLGAPAAESLCSHLADARDDVRAVASLALSVQGTPEARACLEREMRSGPSGTARAAAVSTLPQLLARGQVGVVEGFALVQDRLEDPDPQVKAAALGTLWIFDAGHAQPLAEAARNAADEDVRRAADAALRAIAAARTGEALGGVP
ncbi:MAG TPA: hypothetical protein VFM88_18205, partial [Vicinamibacteria bacterium]|nr:hypothetical protein [Vicinamibacteria bacterium]